MKPLFKARVLRSGMTSSGRSRPPNLAICGGKADTARRLGKGKIKVSLAEVKSCK